MAQERDKPMRPIEGSDSLVVGYGTLLSRASLASSVGAGGQTKTFLPVVVEGFRRIFNLRPGHYEPSYHLTHEPVELGAMNVQRLEGHSFNGVAFSVSKGEMKVLDEREKYYQRIEVQVEAFPGFVGHSVEAAPSGRGAFVYSAGPESPWVIDDPEMLRPHWRDLILAREGAYALGRAFGEMFDATTYLAGGRTLVVDEYRDFLPPMEDR
jgi:hypothetical protein